MREPARRRIATRIAYNRSHYATEYHGAGGLMPAAARNTLIFCILAAVAAASWFLSRPPAEVSVVSEVEQDTPLGYYLRDAVLIGTDTNGKISYRIYADEVEQHDANDDLVLRKVRVEYDSSEHVPWRLTADEGTVELHGEYLDLAGSVRLSNESEEGVVPTVVKTQQLRLDPASFVASSEEAVAFVRGKARISAVGLRADLKDGRLDLQSQGYGQFDD
jgi:LPS export ABC transporter protein LptC